MHPINRFIVHARYGDFPDEVRKQLSKNLLDLFAATIAGMATPAANIMADYAATAFPGDEATIAGRGRIGSAPGAALADRVEMSVDPDMEARFPDEALARVIVTTPGGRTHRIGPLPAPGDPDIGITFNDIVSKAHRLIDHVKDRSRAEHLVETVLCCGDLRTVEPLAECLVRFGSGGSWRGE